MIDWRGAVRDNWPYKLAAAALAVLLWFNVSAEEQRQEQPVPTRLELIVQDTSWVAVNPPDEVTTTFQGRRGDFFAFALRGNRPVLRKEIRQVTDSAMRVQLSPGEVAFDRQLDVRPVAVRPSEVRLSLEPLTFRRVPVLVELEASAAEGFTLVGPPTVEPESVTVRGARSEVGSVQQVETEPVSLDGLQQTVTRQLPVRLPDGLSTIGLEPDQVLVTLEVDSLRERLLSVPVVLAGPGADGARPEPERVEVTLRGARSALAELPPEAVTAVAFVADRPSEARRVVLEVRLPDGLTVTAVAEPDSVTVTPAPPGEDAAEASGGASGAGEPPGAGEDG